MRRDRRGTAALVAVAVVGAAVIAAVLLVGIRRVPDYPTVSERRDPAVHGTIAYLQQAGDTLNSCVYVVAAAGGEAQQVYCTTSDTAGEVLWQDDGTLVLGLFGESILGDDAILIDPRTGETERISLDWQNEIVHPFDEFGESSQPRGSDGARLVTDESEWEEWDESSTHAWLDIRNSNESRRLVSAHGPRGYTFRGPRWSPDGRWALFLDSADRMLIVREDDPSGVRVVTTTDSPWSWSVDVTAQDVELP